MLVKFMIWITKLYLWSSVIFVKEFWITIQKVVQTYKWIIITIPGLLELLWRVYSEQKLKPCFKKNGALFNKDNWEVNKKYNAQKRHKIYTCCRVSKAKIYLYSSCKIAKAGPGYDFWPEHPTVQINSSSPCLAWSLSSSWHFN